MAVPRRGLTGAPRALVVILPLLLVLGIGQVVAVLARQSDRFRAVVTVKVPRAATAPVNVPSVSDVTGRLRTSPSVARQVSTVTGVDGSRVARELAIAPVSGEAATVSYESSDRRQAGQVALAATRAALDTAFEPALASAGRDVASATSRRDRAVADLRILTTRTGVADPVAVFQAKSAELDRLRRDAADAQARGDAGAVTDLQYRIADTQQDYFDLQALIDRRSALVAEQERAGRALTSAQSRQTLLSSQLRESRARSTVTLRGTRRLADGLAWPPRVALVAAIVISLAVLARLAVSAKPRYQGRAGEAKVTMLSR